MENLNEKMKFISNREELHRIIKENEVEDLYELLARIYSDPNHFIYEILQNADDAKASEIIFEIMEDSVKITHNGERVFDLEDIKGITGIGKSYKKEEIELIGKFGIGFKSVFAISDKPFIKSGKYEFVIEDYIVPKIKEVSNFSKDTIIELPYKSNSKINIEENMIAYVKNISETALLFLNNLNKIIFKGNDLDVVIEREEKKLVIDNIYKIHIKKNDIKYQYLILINSKSQIAFLLENNKIKSLEEYTKINVFFPTAYTMGINFLIHGLYSINYNRESINENDPYNIEIIEEIGESIINSLVSLIKEDIELYYSLLKIIVIINDEVSILTRILLEKIKKEMTLNSVWLDNRDEIVSVNKVLIPIDKRLSTLFLENELNYEQKNWINNEVLKDTEVSNFIKSNCKCIIVDDDFVSSILNDNVYKTKNYHWFNEWYSYILEEKYNKLLRWDNYKYKAAIPLMDDRISFIFDNEGKIDVYFKPKNSMHSYENYKIINDNIEFDENIIKKLNNIGIHNIDYSVYINEYIEKDYIEKLNNNESINLDEYFEWFNKIVDIYINDRKSFTFLELMERLKSIKFIVSTSKSGTTHVLYKPSELFFDNNDLSNVYEGYPDILFINYDMYKEKVKCNENDLNNLLRELGVSNYVPVEGKSISWKKKSELIAKEGYVQSPYGESVKNYCLKYIDKITDCPSAEKTKQLLILLSEMSKNKEFEYFFTAQYEFYYYYGYTHVSKFTSEMLQLLRSKEWINMGDVWRRPCDIRITELNKMGYTISSQLASYLQIDNIISKDINTIAKILSKYNEQKIKEIIDEIKAMYY